MAAAKIFKKTNEFLHEELIMKKLQSPRIVRMFDWNQFGKLSNNYCESCETKQPCKHFKNHSFPYLILEFAEHKELYDYLELCGAFDEATTRYYFSQLLDAIDYLHTHKIYHRDIKPQNILLGKNYEIKLADLGLAADENGELINDTRGTMNYMPPEAFKGENVVEKNKKADIYSAGIVLFNMASGCMPYSIATSEDKLFNKFITNKEHFWNHHRKHSFKGKLDKSLQELLDGMLNPDPEQRWSLFQVRDSTWFSKEKMASFQKVVKEMQTRKSYVELATNVTPEKREEISKLFKDRLKKLKCENVKRISYQDIGSVLWNLYSSVFSK